MAAEHPVLFGGEGTTQGRAHAQHREVGSGDELGGHPLGVRSIGEAHGRVEAAEHAAEDLVVLLRSW